jgi:hypothetical protein
VRILAILAAVVAVSTPVAAATIATTPTTFAADLRKANCGDIIELAPGDYGAVQITRYTAPGVAAEIPATAKAKAVPARCPSNNRLEIRAEDARLSSLRIASAQGVNWYGGLITAKLGVETPGVTLDASRFIRFAAAQVEGHKVGVNATRGTDYEIVGNRLERLRSDGVDVSQAQRVLIENNQVVMTTPIKATYDAKGKLLVDGDHSDGIQAWSVPGTPPVADVTIRGNYFRGVMQGISVFNSNTGGIDRFLVEYNTIDGIDFWHGITLSDARDSIIRYNLVVTRKNAKAWNFPFQPIRTWVSIPSGVRTIACGNIVPAMPGGVGTEPCKTEKAAISAR